MPKYASASNVLRVYVFEYASDAIQNTLSTEKMCSRISKSITNLCQMLA